MARVKALSAYKMAKRIFNYYNATGVQVAQWANQGLHGGLNTGSNTPHVWNDTMKTTIENGELLNLAIDYLKSKGFSVRN